MWCLAPASPLLPKVPSHPPTHQQEAAKRRALGGALHAKAQLQEAARERARRNRVPGVLLQGGWWA